MNKKLTLELLNVAKNYLKKAYSPYSKVQVSAAVLMNDNEIYGGCNIENASYGGTICAERVAISKAISEGAKSIKAIFVMTNQNEIWPPCGMCRQFISEFAQKDTIVIMANKSQKTQTVKFSKLFPDSFNKDFLIK
ncbi:MAG: cytidine deaminase [Bdellovibrionales bacterium]